MKQSGKALQTKHLASLRLKARVSGKCVGIWGIDNQLLRPQVFFFSCIEAVNVYCIWNEPISSKTFFSNISHATIILFWIFIIARFFKKIYMISSKIRKRFMALISWFSFYYIWTAMSYWEIEWMASRCLFHCFGSWCFLSLRPVGNPD